MLFGAPRLIQRAEAVSTPTAPEPHWRQFGIAHHVLKILMAEIGLQRTRVVPVIGELVTAGVAQHVGMSLDFRLARRVAAATMRAKPAVVNGPLRSLVKTNGDLGSCSR